MNENYRFTGNNNKFRIEDRVKRIYYLFLPGLAGHYLSNLMELNP
jgi:hypothetical protein